MKVACPPIALGVLAEGQNSVERCAHLAADFDDHVTIAQVVLAVGLRIVGGVEFQAFQAFQIRPECAEVDVRRRTIQNRSFLPFHFRILEYGPRYAHPESVRSIRSSERRSTEPKVLPRRDIYRSGAVGRTSEPSRSKEETSRVPLLRHDESA